MSRLLKSWAIGFLLFGAGMVHAANYEDPVHGVFKGIYGDTIVVEVPSTVSKSPDSAPGDLNFQVNSNTAYHGFHQLTDLKKGDVVAVDYATSDRMQKLLATAITLEGKPADAGVTRTTTTTTTTVRTY